MPEYELRDNLDRLPKVIYFTESFLNLNIQTFLTVTKIRTFFIPAKSNDKSRKI